MKKAFLSLVFAGSMLLAASACNSTKNVSGSDSIARDTVVMTAPTADTTMKDTSKTMPPDTTKTPKM